MTDINTPPLEENRDQSSVSYEFNWFKYRGPIHSAALKGRDAQGEWVTFFEDTLIPGKTYLLPEGHKIVEAWKVIKTIVPVGAEEEKPA